ncbi:hypothetical protein [Streptomyces sp. NBC_00872]|uniref:hypothetical protein n=1 Tax=Streptomyces sp. NBC_00872 TaxID=2903686 RepID=UPI00386DD558|nr:hypothetical protein OG214_24120 [Streptomyces sp. NBC_00872]
MAEVPAATAHQRHGHRAGGGRRLGSRAGSPIDPVWRATVEAEIARHEWETCACGCGRSAGHLVVTLWDAAEGHPAAFRSLDNHIFIQSNLQPPAPAVCAVLMAMWSASPPRPAVREGLLWALSAVLGSEDDTLPEDPGLYGACAALIRPGLDLARRERAADPDSPAAAYAEDILEVLGQGM